MRRAQARRRGRAPPSCAREGNRRAHAASRARRTPSPPRPSPPSRLAALNNDAFRNRFLERNRPWLIAHMAELLTPRTLDARGPAGDGASTAAYVRGVYDRLTAMSAQSVEVGEDDDDTGGPGGGAAQRAADSMDRELATEDARVAAENAKKWAALPPPSMLSVVLLRGWLFGARKRLRYRQLAVGPLEAQRREKCDACGRSAGEPGCRNLSCGLSTEGEFDPDGLDRLIAGFERSQGVPSGFGEGGAAAAERALDFAAWKSYFRANAEVFMRCEACASKAQAAKAAAALDARLSAEAARARQRE